MAAYSAIKQKYAIADVGNRATQNAITIKRMHLAKNLDGHLDSISALTHLRRNLDPPEQLIFQLMSGWAPAGGGGGRRPMVGRRAAAAAGGWAAGTRAESRRKMFLMVFPALLTKLSY